MKTTSMYRSNFLCAFLLAATFSVASHIAVAQSATAIPSDHQMQPIELSKLLQSSANAPLIVHVGSKLFFEEAHIHGSIYAGPGSQDSGLKALDRTVASQAKDKLIVLYCGCCPWSRCPNVGPAFKHMQELGFTNVKVLYMANNFGDDWVSKGYPTDR